MLNRDEQLIAEVKAEAIQKYGYKKLGLKVLREKIPKYEAMAIAEWMKQRYMQKWISKTLGGIL